MALTDDVAAHYTHGALLAAIDDALAAAGIDPRTIGVEDLSPVDNLHGRGASATEGLIEHLNPSADMRLLDMGSGIGGPARLIAYKTGAHVTGIDITPEFVQVARSLSARTAMDALNTFHLGSALDLPFEEAAFDQVYTHNVAMSIDDKSGFYGEAFRVLKPGGRFVAIDVAQGPGGAPLFPVPWALGPEISFLLTKEATASVLETVGFNIDQVIDETALAKKMNAEQRAANKERGGPPALNPMVVLREDGIERLRNSARSVDEDRTLPVIFICTKPAA